MNTIYQYDPNDPYFWMLFGSSSINYPWGYIMPGGAPTSAHWLRVLQRPEPAPGEMASIYLGEEPLGYTDPRNADRVTFEVSGRHSVFFEDVEYVDAGLDEVLYLNVFNHYGFTTDGSVNSINANVGNHEVLYTTAIKDNTVFLGGGWDEVSLVDQLDIPGTQYWSLIRRPHNELDAYSLLTGKKVTLEGGRESRNAEAAGNRNYGEVEKLLAYDAEVLEQDPNAGPTVFIPGGNGGPNGRSGLNSDGFGLQSNIDLRTVEMVDPGPGYVATAQAFSDSFNLAYFNFIRYTSDNVWVGEATIHDGTAWSTPNDRTVTTAKYGVTAATLDEDAYPLLSTVLGTSRNGTHDLIVEEQATAIAGKLRLYTMNVQSELYNEFNDVYLGSSDPDSTLVNNVELYADNGTSADLATWSDRVALFGFGGNDSLTGGYGRDYIFGGEGTYNKLIAAHIGNRVTGGTGADYFGVGNTNSSGAVTGDNRIVVAVASGVTWEYSTDSGGSWTAGTTADWDNGISAAFTKPVGSFEVRETVSGKALSWFEQGYATDVISDWQAQEDTLVVLSNGTAVISGLQDANGTALSLSGANTFDLRDYAAIATSDQGADGARGGIYSQWDADADGIETVGNVLVQGYHIETLGDIYNNQSVRDAQAIANEAGEDITVRNQGLIVAKGLEGDDVLHDSAGNDYLYGGKGSDLISLAEGGTDRIFFDTFDSTLVSTKTASIHVGGFDGNGDQFFLNKRVIDAFDASGSSRDIGTYGGGGTYSQAVAYNPSINFMHDIFYSPSIYDTNANHRNNDGAGAFRDNSGTDRSSGWGGADGTTFGIGAGMVAGGTVLLFVPFMGGVGAALIATGTVLGAGATFLTTTEHENATYTGNVGHYLNFITPAETGTRVFSNPATSTAQNADQSVKFMDFFQGSNARDGFVEVIEFTAHRGQGIYGYFALHAQGLDSTSSDDETHIFLVASSDNLVEASEAIKVAEINGLLDANDFKVYDGQYDIYNARTEDAIILRTPSVTSVVDQNGDFGLQVPDDAADPNDNDALIEKGGTPDPNELEIAVQLSGQRTAESTIRIYDGRTLIFSGDENSNTEDSSGLVSVSYDAANNKFVVVDGRSIGTVAVDSQVGPAPDYARADPVVIDGVDNNFILQDAVVNYSIELIDGNTGISTRASSGAITVSGGNNVIDGGTEVSTVGDILNIVGTVDYINDTFDANIIEIETIMISAADTNGSGDDDTNADPDGADNIPAIDDGDDAPILNLSKQSDGFIVYGSSISDSITGSTGNDDINGFAGADTINLLSDGSTVDTSGADRVRFVYTDDRLGLDTGYDTVINMYSDDDIYVEAPDGSVSAPGFSDRDGDATRLMYETGSGGNIKVASGTELLVVTGNQLGSSSDLTENIATALGATFDLSGLDGRTPSASTGGAAATNSSVLFAVQSDTNGYYWVGRYEDSDNNDVISGSEIEVFAHVQSWDYPEFCALTW